jgi:uncharacterized protein (DUF4415 family)
MKGKFIMKKSSKTDWNRVKSNDDTLIDYSDIPETDFNFWADAELKSFTKKVDYTFKIDEDLAQWLLQLGSDSNEAVNNILRAYYLVNT